MLLRALTSLFVHEDQSDGPRVFRQLKLTHCLSSGLSPETEGKSATARFSRTTQLLYSDGPRVRAQLFAIQDLAAPGSSEKLGIP